jgi:hypothetical protein
MKNLRKSICFGAAIATALPVTIVVPAKPDQGFRVRDIVTSATADAGENQPMTPQRTMPPARDAEIAVEEEYQIARQRGTAQALELFIARHPDSSLADKARADLHRSPR